MAGNHEGGTLVASRKVVVFSTNRWPNAARAALALAKARFSVAALSPRRSIVRATSVVQRHYHFYSAAALRSICHAVQDWTPDLLVPSDDDAVLALQRIHSHQRTDAGPAARRISELIETSLGNPEYFALTTRKTLLNPFAQSEGIFCPRTWNIDPDNLEQISGQIIFSVLMKADGSWGGSYVRLVKSRGDCVAPYPNFSCRSPGRAAFARSWRGFCRSRS